MSDLLDEYEARTGHSVPIHVDAASGGFIAPFATPKLEWDFRIPRVVSINTSGHKFGLAYVGVGWVVFRSKEFLPKDLIFELHYLGSVEYSFSLNFSRPAHPIIAQYFNFLHLGFEGYRAVALDDLKNARLLSRALEKSGLFEVLSDIHRPVENLTTAIKGAVGFDEGDVEVRTPMSFRDRAATNRPFRITFPVCPLSPSASRRSTAARTLTSSRSGCRPFCGPRAGSFPTMSSRPTSRTSTFSGSSSARVSPLT